MIGMRLLPLHCLFSVANVACRMKGDYVSGSEVSSFAVGTFVPPSSGPSWSAVEVVMQKTDGDKAVIDKNLNLSAFSGGNATDTTLIVTHGSYTIALSYKDDKGRLIYHVCPAAQPAVYVINTPTFTANISICTVNAAADPSAVVAVGSVTVEPASNVSLTPTVSHAPVGGQGNGPHHDTLPAAGNGVGTGGLPATKPVSPPVLPVSVLPVSALPKLNLGVPANAGFKLNDYGAALQKNKGLLAAAIDASGATPQERALIIAIAMQETTTMDIRDRDAHKDGTMSANRSIININYDMLTKLGYVKDDNGASLDDPAQLGLAVSYMLKAFRQWDVQRALNFHRGGFTAFTDGTSYGAADYRNAINSIYNAMAADLTLMSDGRRVEVAVRGV